jgi:hypothetical protein
MESRTHSGTISPVESAELEELVFKLVRERLLKAVGAGGMWTLQFRASTDTDSLFGETIAEYIARDIADQIAETTAAVEIAEASISSVVEDVREEVQPSVELEITVESVEWPKAPAPVEVETTVEEQHDEHRMFKPRKAA